MIMTFLTRRWRLWPAGSGPGSRHHSARRIPCVPLCIELLEARLVPSDGTVPSTVLVKDINPAALSSYPGDFSGLVAINGTTFFDAVDGAHGRELWKSDGTTAGTTLVRDINPSGDSYPDGLTNVNGTLYFSASDGTVASGGDDRQLWKSDGTAA